MPFLNRNPPEAEDEKIRVEAGMTHAAVVVDVDVIVLVEVVVVVVVALLGRMLIIAFNSCGWIISPYTIVPALRNKNEYELPGDKTPESKTRTPLTKGLVIV